MKEIDEELLNLYAQDQEERKQFSELKDDAAKEQMRATMQKHDAKRREAVLELIPPLNSKVSRSAEDYYMAAIIYSRGESAGDRQKAHGYAKKAYALVQYRQDGFAEKVKLLHEQTSNRVPSPQVQAGQTPMTNTPLQQRLNLRRRQQKDAVRKDNRLDRLADQEDRTNDRVAVEDDKRRDKMNAEEALNNRPRCFSCGLQHDGPCPPK